MANVACYTIQTNGHARRTVGLMAAGAQEVGDTVQHFSDIHYNKKHLEEFDTAIFWGYIATCQDIMKGYVGSGKSAVYLDLAYFQRGNCYKVSVNDRHATAYFQNRKHDNTRRLMLQVAPRPWTVVKPNAHILLAGMGSKSAWAEGYEPPETWERAAIQKLRLSTDRPIVYRPKPSWVGARPIEGTIYSDPKTPSAKALHNCFAVVTHHSNMAVDGLVHGVPAFVELGVALPMASSNLEEITSPRYPEGREQWLNDLSYCQWAEDEMRFGVCWRYLKNEGLIK